MRVSRDELCAVLTTGDGGNVTTVVPINPTKSRDNFPWLSGLSTSWERVVWHKLNFSWRPAVGTTTDGTVCYGVDWEPKDSKYAPTRAAIVSLTPVKDHPVWQATDRDPFVGTVNLLQSRRHYLLTGGDLEDSCPGSLLITVQGAPSKKMVGELWVHYDVSFLGPRKSA